MKRGETGRGKGGGLKTLREDGRKRGMNMRKIKKTSQEKTPKGVRLAGFVIQEI